MTFREKLDACAKRNDSLLCVGLDPAVDRLPGHLRSRGVAALADFAKAIIDATADLVCAYKPNTTYFELHGSAGIAQLEVICEHLRQTYPHIPIIIDAKRGDIDRSSEQSAGFVFDHLRADAVTVSPYLGNLKGLDAFLKRADKGIIILCRTSNPGGSDIQDLKLAGGKKIYQAVAEMVQNDWNANNNCSLVVGATYPDELADLRQRLGDDFIFLVPGIGAQGGAVRATVTAGINSHGAGLIINSSSAINYASDGKDFAAAAGAAATKTRDEINQFRKV